MVATQRTWARGGPRRSDTDRATRRRLRRQAVLKPVIPLVALAALFIGAGLLHLYNPALYRPVMPQWLPAHDLLILLSGVAQILGGAGLLVRYTRTAAGIGLILLLIAVFPANVEMLRSAHQMGAESWTLALLWLRLPLQPLLAWWVWRAAVRRRND